MPIVVKFVDNGVEAAKDPFGGVLPSFIVMEKGESLQDKAQKHRVDIYTAAQVRHR